MRRPIIFAVVATGILLVIPTVAERAGPALRARC